jgi:putative transposase
MPRLARVVIPEVPHHVVQRGNRRQRTFFSDADFKFYLSLLRHWSGQTGVKVWAYCLMPNHVHLILVPGHSSALATCMAETHRRYTASVNQREGWSGYLWQGRFSSTPMDERHAIAAARYLAFNPVRARLVARPEDWPYSSARAHLGLTDDGLTKPDGFGAPDWIGLLRSDARLELARRLQLYTRTGRPLGSEQFVTAMEARAGRVLRPRKRGPKQRTGVS